jgi:hypothetical protein
MSRQGTIMTRITAGVWLIALAGGIGVLAQSYDFRSTWKAPGVETIEIAGTKVAALMISHDESLRMSVEEATARQLTARGWEGVAAYRSMPRELLQDAEQARAWFERIGVGGVVVLRVVDVSKETVHSAVMWTTSYYQNFSSYYATGWQTAVPIGRGHEVTTIAVETLLFDVAKGELVWGGVTETTKPGNVQTYVTGLADAIGKELQRERLVAKPRQ